MYTIFMNSKSTKTSHTHTLLVNLSNKINLKKSDKYVPLSNLSIYYTWKNVKGHTKAINSKDHIQHVMIILNYQMDHVLYQIFKIILTISFIKNHEKLTYNSPIRIYVNKTEN